ncbi:ZIP family metal transporter [Gammaproteobacteria bacterium]|nr:ZIP family metal transporter [Gammaproteobacteria bacterium]
MSMTLVTTTIISFISSILGGALPIWRTDKSNHFSWMHHLDALCDGMFIGIAMTHLLPELYEHSSSTEFSLYLALIATCVVGLRKVQLTTSKKNAESIIIYVLLSHCFFEGLAVAIAKCSHVQASLSAAILAHKIIESFVFLNLIARHVKSRKVLIAILPLFAALTPLGILCGVLLQSAPDFLLNLSTALTCGAFLSLGINCVLLNDCHEHNRSISSLWMLSGFIVTLFIL